MKEELFAILQSEAKGQYQAALTQYRESYLADQDDFELWKHYYFFLWYLNVEDAPLGVEAFVEANKLASELQKIALNGLDKFGEDLEGLFVLGYTINLFPYYFGDYEAWEKEGIRLMEKAANLDPQNKIYKMVYLGQEPGWKTNADYENACIEAADEVKEIYKGKGLLNAYFREVLYRVKK